MQQKLFKIFLSQEAGAFGNNIEKEPPKPRPKLKKYVYYKFTENICSAGNSVQVVVFCKKVLTLWNHDSTFSHFEGSIIPPQKITFFIEDFFSKCDQIRSFLTRNKF